MILLWLDVIITGDIDYLDVKLEEDECVRDAVTITTNSDITEKKKI